MKFISRYYRKFVPVIAIICFTMALNGCTNLDGRTQSEDFYTADREADLYRIPLIEPYQLINTGFIEESWFFELPDSLLEIAGNQIAVDAVWVDSKDSLIVLYSESIYLQSEMTEAWFLFDFPAKNSRSFKTEQEFERALGKKVQLRSCASVYKEFVEMGKLPWR